jgi:hypothetical protein
MRWSHFFDLFTLMSMLMCAIHFYVIFSGGWSLYDRATFMQRAPTTIVKGNILDVTFQPPEYVCHYSSANTNSSPDCHYDSSNSCNARVQFSPSPEQLREVTYRTGIGTLSECRAQVGKTVEVAYHTAHPEDARVPVPLVSPFEVAVYLFFALFFLVFWVCWWRSLLGSRW